MMKLNYKRTFLIGFAFFGILLLWQVYDSWCPTFLTDIFARRMYGISSAELKAGEPEKIHGLNLLMSNQTGREFEIDGRMASSVEVIAVTVSEFSAKMRKTE